MRWSRDPVGNLCFMKMPPHSVNHRGPPDGYLSNGIIENCSTHFVSFFPLFKNSRIVISLECSLFFPSLIKEMEQQLFERPLHRMFFIECSLIIGRSCSRILELCCCFNFWNFSKLLSLFLITWNVLCVCEREMEYVPAQVNVDTPHLYQSPSPSRIQRGVDPWFFYVEGRCLTTEIPVDWQIFEVWRNWSFPFYWKFVGTVQIL